MTKIVGILNVTSNSFSDGGLYNTQNSAVAHYKQLIKDGADLVDIGAQSTSYDAQIMSQESEWNILEPILKSLQNDDGLQNVSIDTFNCQTAKDAIDYGVSIINDVCGAQSSEILELIAQNQK